MRLSVDVADVTPADEYAIAGVFSFGRGLFKRGPIAATETRYTKLHRLHVGQLVVSRLKAFEGALAVVPPELDGWFLSPEFPTFECIEGRLHPAYLAHVCRWPDLWSMLADASRGIGARRERVHVEDLLRLELAIPPLDEQRRVAEHLDRIAVAGQEVQARLSLADEIVNALLSSLASTEGKAVQLQELLEPATRPVALQPDVTYSLLGCRWYGDGLFVREQKEGGDVSASTLFEVQAGDLVYNRLFAWKGSFAIADPLVAGCLVSGEFPVFRIDTTRVLPEFLAGVMRTPRFLEQVDARSSGSTPTSRNRLKEREFLQIEVTLPTMSRQRRVSESLVRAHQTKRLRERQQAVHGALIPSGLNQAFAGLS